MTISFTHLRMDEELVEADRESYKIGRFIDAMVAQSKMTEFEKQVVEQEAESVERASGRLDARGKITRAGALGGEDEAAVMRHANFLRRKKIIEFHPELADELDRFIEHRPYHPLPPIPANLSSPGAALRQYLTLVDYVHDKRSQGVITHEEAWRIYASPVELFRDSGVYDGALDERTDKAVLVQAHHLMRKELLTLHPELADEVRNLGAARSR